MAVLLPPLRARARRSCPRLQTSEDDGSRAVAKERPAVRGEQLLVQRELEQHARQPKGPRLHGALSNGRFTPPKGQHERSGAARMLATFASRRRWRRTCVSLCQRWCLWHSTRGGEEGSRTRGHHRQIIRWVCWAPAAHFLPGLRTVRTPRPQRHRRDTVRGPGAAQCEWRRDPHSLALSGNNHGALDTTCSKVEISSQIPYGFNFYTSIKICTTRRHPYVCVVLCCVLRHARLYETHDLQ